MDITILYIIIAGVITFLYTIYSIMKWIKNKQENKQPIEIKQINNLQINNTEQIKQTINQSQSNNLEQKN
jgi:hypothetical protein